MKAAVLARARARSLARLSYRGNEREREEGIVCVTHDERNTPNHAADVGVFWLSVSRCGVLCDVYWRIMAYALRGCITHVHTAPVDLSTVNSRVYTRTGKGGTQE